MKNLVISFLLVFVFGSIQAQIDTIPISSYTSQFDSTHAPLISEVVPYNRLYDRVFPWAGLDNTTSGDTVSFTLFKQAWYELELSRLSSIVPSYTSYKSLADSVYSTALKNKIQLTAIAVKMATIDTLAYTDGRLDSTATGWGKVSGQPTPYLDKNVTIAALAKTDLVVGTNYMLELKSTHIQNTDRPSIASIQVTEPVNNIDITLTPGQIKNFVVIDSGRYYVTIRVNFSGGSSFINKQEIEVGNPAVYPPPCDRTKMVIESDIPYQGFGESDATTSLADVYIYYHRDANGECEPHLKKPIIICDGFDPTDQRKIDGIEKFFEFNSISNEQIDGIDKLRTLGFDVIIMNFPVIGSAEVDFRSGVRNASNVYVNRDKRDGGADYTERNAMLMVKLIQIVNDELTTNGSTEKLCILGPSMGGQITRYALAYMEEQNALSVPNMNHNTRVWCSFESPHHGANIPIGTTGLLATLAYKFGNVNAKESFEMNLASKAAQQYLINQSVYNNSSILLTQNNSATNRQLYMSSLTSNGLMGSNGWPQSVKRIAVANSSDVGVRNGSLAQEALYLKGKVWFLKVLELQAFLQNDFNFTNDPLYKARIFKLNEERHLKNFNPPGSLDILPGSLSNTTQIIFDGLLKGINEGNPKITITEKRLKPKHTFMPVISTLAFNNTNVDWGQVLNNRDLVCTEEIPFHAYKISGTNQDHITITEDIYNWLENQFLNGDIGCDPLCGSYSISGDQQICDGNMNTVHTYTFNGGIGAGETLTWTVTGDLIVTTSSDNTVGVKITATNGSGMVIATLNNACGDKVVQNFHVTVGSPNIYLTPFLDTDECIFTVTIHTTPAGKIPLSYQWSTDGVSYTNGSVSKEFSLEPNGISMWLYARADWGCGFTEDNMLLHLPPSSICYGMPLPPLSNTDMNLNEGFLITPNPTLTGWNLKIPDTTKDKITISISDMNGRLLSKQQYIKERNSIFIAADKLIPGLYFINISNLNTNITLKAMKL